MLGSGFPPRLIGCGREPHGQEGQPYTSGMVTQTTASNRSLFGTDIEDRVLLICHVLGKPTAKQVHRLLRGQLSFRQVQGLLLKLGRGADRVLNRINPMDIENPIRSLPYVYLDTRKSRRRIEEVFGVPYRRVPPVPSRDWRFLRHDVQLIDPLVSLELTAQALQLPHGYQAHFGEQGEPLYPRVTVVKNDLIHSLRPQPDKTVLINGHVLPYEYDLGEEQISLGNIIRDSSITRKLLVYEQVEQSGALDQLGWGPRIYPMVVNTKKNTKKSSRARIKVMLESMPPEVRASRVYFIDQQTHDDAGDDVSEVEWLRGDGRMMPLPCWR